MINSIVRYILILIVLNLHLHTMADVSELKKDAVDNIKDSVLTLKYIPEHKSIPIDSNERIWNEADKIINVLYKGGTESRADSSDIIYEAKRAGIEPALVFALTEKLSGFDENYEDHNGNIGLLAIQPSIHHKFGNKRNTLYLGKYNLRLGRTILSELIRANPGKLHIALRTFLIQVSRQNNADEKLIEVFEIWKRRDKQLNKTLVDP